MYLIELKNLVQYFKWKYVRHGRLYSCIPPVCLASPVKKYIIM